MSVVYEFMTKSVSPFGRIPLRQLNDNRRDVYAKQMNGEIEQNGIEYKGGNIRQRDKDSVVKDKGTKRE